ncbi:MAG: sugar phosphate isomerase/epimerase family protein [Candidatus Bathyarchaeia archaeon]
MPKLALGLNAFLWGSPKQSILEFASNLGFDGIELHQRYEPYVKGHEKEIRKEYERLNLEVPAIQTGGEGFVRQASPVSCDEKTRKRYVVAIKDQIEFCRELGATNAGLWPGGGYMGPNCSYETQLENLIDSWSRVTEVAEENDIILSFEPEPNAIFNGGYFRRPLDTILQVLDAIESRHFNVLFDFAHADFLSKGNTWNECQRDVKGDILSYLKSLKSRVGWVHVCDTNGRLTPFFKTGQHLAIGEGYLDNEEILRALKEECPHLKWLQIDVWENPHPFETAKHNLEEIKGILKRISW